MGLIFDDPEEERAFMEADFSASVSRLSLNEHDRNRTSINASESVPVAAEHGRTPTTDPNSNRRSYHEEMVARFEAWINNPQQQVAGPSHSTNPPYAGPVWPPQEESRASRFHPYTTSRRQQPTETLIPTKGGEFNDAPPVKRARLNPRPVAATGKKNIAQLRSPQGGMSSSLGQQNHGYQEGFLGRGRSQAGGPSAPFTFQSPHGPSPLSRSVSYPAPIQANPSPVFDGSVSAGSTSTTSSTAPSGRADSGVVVPLPIALPPAVSLTNTLSAPPSAIHNDQLMQPRDLNRINPRNLVFAFFNECLQPPFGFPITSSEICTWNPDWTLLGKVTDRTMQNGLTPEELSTLQLQAYGLVVNEVTLKKVGDRLKKQRSRFGKEIYNVAGRWDVNIALRAGPQNDLKADTWDDGQVTFQHAKLSDVYAPIVLAKWPTGQDRGIMTMCLDWARQNSATYPDLTTRDWNWIVQQLGNQAVSPVALAPHANLDVEKKAAMNP